MGRGLNYWVHDAWRTAPIGCAASRGHEAEVLLHGREIAAVVQQRAATFDAKRAVSFAVTLA
jgi:hypothetical protein